MKGAKIAGAFAAAGFVLSFVSGLFSGGGVGHVLGMAVLFAVVFGALGCVVQWLAMGVLNVNNASDSGAADGQAVADKTRKTGATIDVIVKDEELPSEENSPRFFVGNNHQMLNASDYGTGRERDEYQSVSADSEEAVLGGDGRSAPVQEDTSLDRSLADNSAAVAASKAEGSEPIAKSSVLSNNTSSKPSTAGFEPITLGTEKVQVADFGGGRTVSSARKATQDEDDLEDELDEIPEFQGFATVEDDGSPRNISGEMIEDSDFSQDGAPIKKKVTVAETQDAALMAKAISTVLATDK